MKELDYGKGYRYAHDEEEGSRQARATCPRASSRAPFYRPVERGLESASPRNLRDLRKRNDEAAG